MKLKLTRPTHQSLRKPVNRTIPTSSNRSGNTLRRIALILVFLALLAAGGWYALRDSLSAEKLETLAATVKRTNLRITVTERGTLKSQKTVNGICEVEGYENKIISIVEEGATVKEGDVVVRLDSSKIDQRIDEANLAVNQYEGEVQTRKQELEVQRNTNESDIATAELELTLAELDLDKYEKGDYEVALNDFKGKIALATVELEKAREYLESIKVLVKKGFREPEQVRQAEQAVESTTFNLERDQRQLEVLIKYDHIRKLTEYQAKAVEAKRKLERTKSNAAANLKKAESALEAAEGQLRLQKEQLAEIERQKSLCEIKAEQTGVVAYANEEWWSESRRIREGGTVYERQVVFFIPDMTLMQVETKIHESEVKRVAAGQKALLRVDAFPDQTFTGTVKSVAQLSQSDRFFGAGVKEYTAIVTFDDKASVALRPGMTAEVEILVDSLSDVLTVPVQAVAQHRRKHFVYVQTEEGFERVDVEVGPTNNRLIVIESGIEEGTIVAMDARSRAAKEFAGDEGTDASDEVSRLEEMKSEEAAATTEEPEAADAPETTDDVSAAETTEASDHSTGSDSESEPTEGNGTTPGKPEGTSPAEPTGTAESASPVPEPEEAIPPATAPDATSSETTDAAASDMAPDGQSEQPPTDGAN
ncbi:MAG: efflux RND transporter periplasmic adaptor subunit [Planctomycetaceae bacterium]|nr:efflux RND transporter periplasmic adaptor subunit [Planctomycetaceae bacterium]